MHKVRIRPGLLKRLRELRGTPTMEQQARLLGVERTTLRRVDAGATPSGAFMAAVCQTYDMSLGEAFESVPDRAALHGKAAS